MTPSQRDISRKLRILNYAKQIGNVTAACRHFGISREISYKWERAYEKAGEATIIPNVNRGYFQHSAPNQKPRAT
jgi:transposase-like protein